MHRKHARLIYVQTRRFTYTQRERRVVKNSHPLFYIISNFYRTDLTMLTKILINFNIPSNPRCLRLDLDKCLYLFIRES